MHRDRGYILLLSLIFVATFIMASATVVSVATQSVRSERVAIANAQALALAEAGIDKAAYELNRNPSYTNETTQFGGDDGAFETEVTSVDGATKRVVSTGYAPNMTSPIATRVVVANIGIDASVVSFRFGVQVGDGGIVMENNSVIHGNLYSNGSVSGGGRITGDVSIAAGTNATPNQSWIVQNSFIDIAKDATTKYVAQSFRPSASGYLNRVTLNLKKTGSPGDISISIAPDNGGKPSITPLVTGTIPASWVTGSFWYAEAALTSLVSLVANQTYWIVATAPVNANHYFTWGSDSLNGYTNGMGMIASNWTNATTWIAANDLDFKIHLNGATTSVSGVTVNGNAWAQRLQSCTIGGTAKYQAISSCTVTGQQFPGTTPLAPGTMPISDAQIDEWEAVAAAGGVIAGPYNITGTQTLGPKKINGNLSLGVNAKIILSGPVWVSGNITFGNNATLTVSSGTGNSGAILIADVPGSESTLGRVTMSNNMIVSGNGSATSYPMIISTNTGSNAILLSNNADSVILYAPRGQIEVVNNAGASQITAHSVYLNQNAEVTYVSGLQNTSFSNGPGGSWAYIPGSYAIIE